MTAAGPQLPRRFGRGGRVRRRGDPPDQLAVLRQQAHVEALATQIPPRMQHEHGPPRARSPIDTRERVTREPSFIAFHSERGGSRARALGGSRMQASAVLTPGRRIAAHVSGPRFVHDSMGRPGFEPGDDEDGQASAGWAVWAPARGASSVALSSRQFTLRHAPRKSEAGHAVRSAKMRAHRALGGTQGSVAVMAGVSRRPLAMINVAPTVDAACLALNPVAAFEDR